MPNRHTSIAGNGCPPIIDASHPILVLLNTYKSFAIVPFSFNNNN